MIAQHQTDGRRISVVVIGAGIAGLTAAWRLQERGFAVTVLEEAERPGGRMTERRAGRILYNSGARLAYRFGADFNALVRDAGLEKARVPVRNPEALCQDDRGEYRLQLMPGLRSMTTARLTPAEKLRLLRYGGALLLRRPALSPDELTSALEEDGTTLAEHVRQHLGARFLEDYIDPLFRGTRSWNPEEISSAFFVSTLAHLIGERSVFAFEHGMGQLTDHLAARLPVRLHCRVASVRRRAGGGCLVACEEAGRPLQLEPDLVVMATEGNRVAALLNEPLPEESEFLAQVRYNPVGIVHYALTGELTPVMRFFARRSGNKLSTYQQLPAAPAAGRSLGQLYCQLTPEAVAEAAAIGTTHDLDGFVRDQVRTLLPTIDSRCAEAFTQWIPNKLPVPYPGYGKAVRRFLDWHASAKRTVYYCGDYLSQALVTGAAHSGAQTAALIAAHHSSRGEPAAHVRAR